MTRSLPEHTLAPLDGFEVEVWDEDRPVPRPTLLAEAARSDGLLTMLTDQVDKELLDAAPRLRVISQMAVGVDNIDVEECLERGLKVGHTPDVLTETVADTAFALLAAVVRRIPEGAAEVRAGEWGEWSPFHLVGHDLHDSVLGIVGMGRIGRAVARRASGFDMDVIYTSRRESGVGYPRLELTDLLREADFVVITVPLTTETTGLFSDGELAAMKPGSFLVNVSRGPIVDTDALVRALDSGHLGGVGLDVTDPEPLPSDHELVGFPNCLVIPHIGSASVRTREKMAGLAALNLAAGLRGEKMPAQVM